MGQKRSSFNCFQLNPVEFSVFHFDFYSLKLFNVNPIIFTKSPYNLLLLNRELTISGLIILDVLMIIIFNFYIINI